MRLSVRGGACRPRPLVMALGAVLALAACERSYVADPSYRAPEGEVTLGVGDAVRVADGTLRLTFIGIDEDSRCPEDVVCVWEGNAGVRLSVAPVDQPELAREFVLHTTQAVGARSETEGGWRILLEEVLPVPRSDAPTPLRYSVRLTVSQSQ